MLVKIASRINGLISEQVLVYFQSAGLDWITNQEQILESNSTTRTQFYHDIVPD
jgi:hypothetical protein